MKRFAAILCLLSSPAFAEGVVMPESPFCVTQDAAKIQASDYILAHPDVSMRVIDGNQAAAWAEAFNSLPPVSNAKADTLWAVHYPAEETWLVEFFYEKRGCFTAFVSERAFDAISEHAKAGRL